MVTCIIEKLRDEVVAEKLFGLDEQILLAANENNPVTTTGVTITGGSIESFGDYVLIKGKSAVTRIEIASDVANIGARCDDFKYFTKLNYLVVNSGSSFGIKGDINDLPKSLTEVGLLYLRKPISSLGSLIGLTSIRLNYTYMNGAVEDFVKAQVHNGRATGSVTFNASSFSTFSITYNGELVKTASTLTWSTSGGVITLTYDGIQVSIEV